MADLIDRLQLIIRSEGPLGIDRYMADALGHPTFGYYMRQDPFGVAGDFVTAPEISQMYGELIGIWCAAVWQEMGAPSAFRLVELGPGRGTLMSDLMRACAAVSGFSDAAAIDLVEISPALRRMQQDVLRRRATWRQRFEEVPDGPLIVIASEFFDALPVRQFVRTERGWCERMVDLDPAAPLTAPALRFVLSPDPLPDPSILPPAVREAPVGAVAEVSPARAAAAEAVGARIAAFGGAMLVLDYGHDQSGAGDTLQAIRRHTYHDILREPGMADLTAHVDFEALARAANLGGAAAWRPVSQREFLLALGIEARAERLRQNATESQQSAIEAAQHRLTDPDEMGSLFLASAITHPSLPAPIPFREKYA